MPTATAEQPADIHMPPAPRHSRWSATVFGVKRKALQVRRWALDKRTGVRASPIAVEADGFPFLLAEHVSPLWTEAAAFEQRLQFGKVQNLRVAVRCLNGATLPANEVFSFWHQIGPPTARRGFVPGRELREGCLIPAVGGGICQLSNALYAAALAANAEIVERHAHSQVVPNSAASAGRDATVAYNYIDLRFRVRAPVLIEARLTHDTLTVRFWGREAANSAGPAKPAEPAPKHVRGSLRRVDLLLPTPNSCVSCGQETCFRHAPEIAGQTQARSAFLLFRPNTEFERFAAETRTEEDTLLLPLANRRLASGRYAAASVDGISTVRAATGLVVRQMIAARWMAKREKNAARRARRRREADALAAAYDRLLHPEETHLIVDQELLPFLWRRGTLGGRTFDVFATQMPLAEMQRRLDAAASRHPESRSLGDFRVSASEWEAERAALAAARRILTPHPEILRQFSGRAVPVPWAVPTSQPRTHSDIASSPSVLFVGPTIGRKGCYEVREAVRALNLPLIVLGRCLEGADFWQGIEVRQLAGDADLSVVPNVVVQPSLWEVRPPRALLDALAAGIPVVATPGCGLGERDGVTTVPFGDATLLTTALLAASQVSRQKPKTVE